MNNIVKEILRWSAVVSCGGVGSYGLATTLGSVLTWPQKDWFFMLAVVIPTLLLCFGPFLLVAYFCLRRQYCAIFKVLGGVLAVVVFLGVGSLPGRSGLAHWMFNSGITSERPWLEPLVLIVGLACIFAPFWAAGWTFRFCLRLADHFFPASPMSTYPA